MKWLRREPSWGVQYLTVLGCVIVLLIVGLWVSMTRAHHGSVIGGWLRAHTVGRPSRLLLPQQMHCYVTWVEGKMEILGDGTTPSQETFRARKEQLYAYQLTAYPSGVFAPATMRIQHDIYKIPLGNGFGAQEFLAFSRRWGLGLTPGEGGHMAFDPRINDNLSFAEFRPIWSGYGLNALALLAISGIVWSLAWVPFQILHQVQRKRYARGLCPLCAYDLSATPDRCPECGWRVLRTASGLPSALKDSSRDERGNGVVTGKWGGGMRKKRTSSPTGFGTDSGSCEQRARSCGQRASPCGWRTADWCEGSEITAADLEMGWPGRALGRMFAPY